MPATIAAPRQVHSMSNSESKLIVIRGYLQKNVSHGSIHEASESDGGINLTVTCGGISYCTVQVSSALLSDENLTSTELRWALKERDIVRKILSNDCIYLNHEMLRTGNMSANARWPRQMRISGNE